MSGIRNKTALHIIVEYSFIASPFPQALIAACQPSYSCANPRCTSSRCCSSNHSSAASSKFGCFRYMNTTRVRPHNHKTELVSSKHGHQIRQNHSPVSGFLLLHSTYRRGQPSRFAGPQLRERRHVHPNREHDCAATWQPPQRLALHA